MHEPWHMRRLQVPGSLKLLLWGVGCLTHIYIPTPARLLGPLMLSQMSRASERCMPLQGFEGLKLGHPSAVAR